MAAPIKKYKVVEDWLDPSNRVAMIDVNILVQSENLDDLLEWENLLSKKELDYCIISTTNYYAIITNMDKYSGRESGIRAASGFGDE